MFPLFLYAEGIHHPLRSIATSGIIMFHRTILEKKSSWDFASRKEPVTARMLKIWRKTFKHFTLFILSFKWPIDT